MGFLDHGLLLSLEEDAEPDSFDFGFHQADAEPMAPTAVALRDAAQEHFAFVSAVEYPEGEAMVSGLDMDTRVGRLEQLMEGLATSVSTLVSRLEPASSQATPLAATPKRASAMKTAGVKAHEGSHVSFAEKFPMMDPTVVTAALQAGVEEESLREMQKLLGAVAPMTKRLKEPGAVPAVKASAKPSANLSETDSDKEVSGGWYSRSFASHGRAGGDSSCRDSGCAGCGQVEEEANIKVGSGFGRHQCFRHQRHYDAWQWQEGGSSQKSAEVKLAGVSGRSVSTYREDDAGGLNAPDPYSGNARSYAQLQSLDGTPFQDRPVQDGGLSGVDRSGCSRLHDSGQHCRSKSTSSIDAFDAGSMRHRSWQLAFSGRTFARAATAPGCLECAQSPFCQQRRATFQQDLRCKMGRGCSQPFAGGGRLCSSEVKTWPRCSGDRGEAGSKRKSKGQGEVFGHIRKPVKLHGAAGADGSETGKAGLTEASVPGRGAPTVFVPQLLNSMCRLLLQCGGGLASFVHSVLSRKPYPEKEKGPFSRELWPMPVPYPEVFKAVGGSFWKKTSDQQLGPYP